MPKVGIALVVRRANQVLVQRRIAQHAYGCWGLPGGHLEKWETFEEAALRELREEAGPNLLVTQPTFWTVTNCFFRAENHHYVTIFMISDFIKGKAILAEPDKADEQRWCFWSQVPCPRMPALQLLYDTGLSPMPKEIE